MVMEQMQQMHIQQHQAQSETGQSGTAKCTCKVNKTEFI